MWNVLIQFFATKFLVLALHLDTDRFPRPLSAREEAEAFAALRRGDSTARELLIRHNLRLVAHIAKKYYAVPGDQEDFISVGTIGLIKAVNTFDSSRRARFSSYSCRCIENKIRMYLRRSKKSSGTLSLQEILEADGESGDLTLSDILQDNSRLEEDYEKQCDSARLHTLLDRLGARERQILLLRYGLNGGTPLTQLETASLLNISRSYVSRLESRALSALRRQWQETGQ